MNPDPNPMPQHIRIVSVNTSTAKDAVMHFVDESNHTGQGMTGVAFYESGNKQVSLLGKESLDRFTQLTGHDFSCGLLGEDLSTEGMDLIIASPLDRFIGDQIELEVTQAGIGYHEGNSAIFMESGQSALPKEGIYARVIKPGKVKPGDVLRYQPKIWRIEVITLSDRASRGEYADRSGPRVAGLLETHFKNKSRQIHLANHILPDDAGRLEALINEGVTRQTDVIMTTGGTGVGYRDITVDTIRPMLSMEIPGIMEMIRVRYGAIKPNALLSRSIAGFIDRTLLYTLPGSVKAVDEYMEEIMKTLEHLLYMRYGLESH